MNQITLTVPVQLLAIVILIIVLNVLLLIWNLSRNRDLDKREDRIDDRFLLIKDAYVEILQAVQQDAERFEEKEQENENSAD